MRPARKFKRDDGHSIGDADERTKRSGATPKFAHRQIHLGRHDFSERSARAVIVHAPDRLMNADNTRRLVLIDQQFDRPRFGFRKRLGSARWRSTEVRRREVAVQIDAVNVAACSAGISVWIYDRHEHDAAIGQ